jgi:hypothetical protein
MNVQQDDQNRTKERKDSSLPATNLFKMGTPIGSFADPQDFLIRIRNGRSALSSAQKPNKSSTTIRTRTIP